MVLRRKFLAAAVALGAAAIVPVVALAKSVVNTSPVEPAYIACGKIDYVRYVEHHSFDPDSQVGDFCKYDPHPTYKGLHSYEEAEFLCEAQIRRVVPLEYRGRIAWKFGEPISATKHDPMRQPGWVSWKYTPRYINQFA